MKSNHKIALTGLVNGKPAKTQQANEVTMFSGDYKDSKHYFMITKQGEKSVSLKTPKGRYFLKRNEKTGIYQTETKDGVKIHVCIKKIVGHIIWWA